MNPRTRVLVTGGSGMVSSTLTKYLRGLGVDDVLSPSRKELDLQNRPRVFKYFGETRPEVVFMCAAKVGGIAANMADPAGFLSDNLHITLNVLEACAANRTPKSVFIGSSCIYPRACPQPMKEESLLTGPLEPTNEGYALAKIVGLRLAQYLWRQQGLRVISPMPSNIYGTGDHFDLERSHVLSALVRRFVEAADAHTPEVTLWGTGVARREFIHVDDVARALVLLVEKYESPEVINVGPGTDVSIAELARLVSNAAGYTGSIAWDATKPDGMPRKCMDVTRITELGFKTTVGLDEGIRRTIAEFRVISGSARHE